jgi:mannose-6-phosphate isomerase-like protein (cupin superfamily)
MSGFETKALPAEPDLLAPDGSAVRILLSLGAGSMAHFELAPGQTSLAVVHRSVAEIWYVVSGRGEMWRAAGAREETTPLAAGVCLTIPVGTRFQFRAGASEGLCAVAVTMPPWPGPDEAQPVVGCW